MWVFMADNGGHEDALFRLDPAAVFGETAQGAGRGDNSSEGGNGVGGFVEDVLKNVVEIAATNLVEAESIGVTIDGDPVDFVVVAEEISDGLRTVPVDEHLLDHLALGVTADGALATVTREIRSGTKEFGRTRGAKIVFRLRDSGDARGS